MVNWPTSRDLWDLRGFLELMRYYRRFVRGYGKIIEPLANLKKKTFMWSDRAQKTFEEFKEAMVTMLILGMLDFLKNFVVEMDASKTGLGTILMQGDCPIFFLNKALSLRNQD